MGAAQEIGWYPLKEVRKARIRTNGCSSIGRVVVSKTIGWEFESLHPCKYRGCKEAVI
jgi:hypothetical protein